MRPCPAQATIDLIEMILAKCDQGIAELYDKVLVQAPEEQQLGAELRAKLGGTIKVGNKAGRAGGGVGKEEHAVAGWALA